MLADISKLEATYYDLRPDAAHWEQRVTFGTSGHRGSSLRLVQRVAHPRHHAGDLRVPAGEPQSTGRCFWASIRTRFPSRPSPARMEVLAANGVEVMIRREHRLHADAGDFARHPDLQPRAATTGLADGIVITPSHNPPRGWRVQIQSAARRSGRAARSQPRVQDRANELLDRRLERRAAHAARAGAARIDHAPPRLPRRLCRRSGERHRFGGDPRGRHPARRRSAGRRRRPLLGPDRRTLSAEPDGGQQGRRSHLSLHDASIGMARSAWIRRRLTPCRA